MSKRDFFKKIWSMCYLSAGGAVFYGGLSVYNNNEKFYGEVLMPLIRRLDPELSHNIAVKSLKYQLIPKSKYIDNSVLKTSFLGRELNNPIGIAAGFDKQGEAVSGLEKIGFSIIEIGSVTPNPQPGNPKPRVFRLPEDSAIINRYGFNSDGHMKVLQNLEKNHLNNNNNKLLGVNLGKNKESPDALNDYEQGIKLFANVADYLVVNISSPNTAGLRDLQKKDSLYELLTTCVSAKNSLGTEKKPYLFLKLSPDLSEKEKKDIANILSKKECKIDGLIISNTTLQRPNLINQEIGNETGGLSGKPLKDLSTNMIRDMFKMTKGKIPIIGVGGVSNGQDAFEKILAGASIVQLYSAFIYEGPPIVSQIKSELSDCLLNHGFQNVNEAVGKENQVKKK